MPSPAAIHCIISAAKITASRLGGDPIIAHGNSLHAYDAVARRPNTADVLQRSDSHPGALTSIHRCASCCVTKPGI
jgi:hypothetical protein